MADVNLLAFGCTVTFIAVAGAYLILRERFAGADEAEPVRVQAEPVHVAVARPVAKPAAR